MAKGKFLIFKTHKEAKKFGCFNCTTGLSNQKHEETLYAPGNGHFSIKCPKCGYITYYDIKKMLGEKDHASKI